MRIDKLRPTVFQVTLHAYELSALVAGARWAAENGDLPADAREQLEDVLAEYDAEFTREGGVQVEGD
jgi:hypothetical protein